MKISTAPGPDGIRVDVLGIGPAQKLLCALFNLILFLGYPPSVGSASCNYPAGNGPGNAGSD